MKLASRKFREHTLSEPGSKSPGQLAGYELTGGFSPRVPGAHLGILVNNTLTLCGERKHEAEVKEDRYHRVERAYGTFQRSFVPPTMVDQEKVQATCHDGILELRLPKSEAAKPKRIAISS